MFLRSTHQRFMLVLTVFFILATGIVVPSVDAAVNFAGKRVSIIVPFDPGGGADTLARYLAPYFHKYLPGNPAIIVRNIPGAGSIKGTNMFEEVKRDGRTILCASASTFMNYVMQDKRIKFHPDKWIPLLNAPTGAVTYARKDLGLTGNSLEDIKILQKQQIIFGCNSPTSSELARLLGMYFLGLNVKPVFGLNRGPVRLAFERGEFTINYDTMSAYLQQAYPMIESGVAVPIYTDGVWSSQKKQWVADPTIPELPPLVQLYEGIYGKKPSGPTWKVLSSMMSVVNMANKLIALPSDTPKDIAETWHIVCEKTVNDEKFIKEKELQIGKYDLPLREDAKENIMNSIDIDDESRAWLRTFLREKYDVKLD